MNLFPKMESSMGLHLIFLEICFSFLFTWSMAIFPSEVIVHYQSGSITMVEVLFMIKAGPSNLEEGCRSSMA